MTDALLLQREPRTEPATAPRLTTAAAFNVTAATDALAERLATTAVERDRTGGHAAQERGWVRESGLLALTIPTEHGGLGADGATFQASVRRLAQVDSALAHVYAFHHLQLAGVQLWGTPQQQRDLLACTVEERLFWGNALNPMDRRAVARRARGGWLIDGPKSYCSGSVGSDWLTVSGWHEASESLLIGVARTGRDGISVQADWDAFGQKQTDSGTVVFNRLFLADDAVLVAPGSVPTPRSTLRTQVAQLIMANLYLGIAIGAFDEGRAQTRAAPRAWPASGVATATDDPYVQHRYGELWLLIRPAVALADEAAACLDQAMAQSASLSDADRGAVAIAVAEAKVLAHRAAIEVGSQVFELTGARATSQRLGLDRHWRNARVHTLHDPVDYKLRDIGRHVLDGRWPEPTAYS